MLVTFYFSELVVFHDNWVFLFVVLIVVSIITGAYATRGILRAIRTLVRGGARDAE